MGVEAGRLHSIPLAKLAPLPAAFASLIVEPPDS